MKNTFSIFAFLVIALAIPAVAQEEESDVDVPENFSGRSVDYNQFARLPYRQLIKIAQSDARSPKDTDEYRMRIQSRNPAIKSEDIELFLDIKDNPMVLVVDNEGILTVPFRQDLMESNPDLIANQPRGTLNIYVDLEVPKVTPPEIKDGKVSYQELFRPLVEIQDEMRKVDPTFGLTGQRFVLEIETGESPVKITRETGARTFKPNMRGKVYMIMETYLYEENPMVELPDDAKLNVIPATQEEVADIRSK